MIFDPEWEKRIDALEAFPGLGVGIWLERDVGVFVGSGDSASADCLRECADDPAVVIDQPGILAIGGRAKGGIKKRPAIQLLVENWNREKEGRARIRAGEVTGGFEESGLAGERQPGVRAARRLANEAAGSTGRIPRLQFAERLF